MQFMQKDFSSKTSNEKNSPGQNNVSHFSNCALKLMSFLHCLCFETGLPKKLILT